MRGAAGRPRARIDTSIPRGNNRYNARLCHVSNSDIDDVVRNSAAQAHDGDGRNSGLHALLADDVIDRVENVHDCSKVVLVERLDAHDTAFLAHAVLGTRGDTRDVRAVPVSVVRAHVAPRRNARGSPADVIVCGAAPRVEHVDDSTGPELRKAGQVEEPIPPRALIDTCGNMTGKNR